MPRRHRIIIFLLAPVAASMVSADAQPAGQPENPVFVNDSPAAAEAMGRVQDHLRSGNLEQAVRLLQRLLEESADALVLSPNDPFLYVPVRQRIHAQLLAEPALLARYRESQQPVAAELLRQGRPAVAERTALLTTAGFDGALRLAQEQMESASFGLARLTLEQLDEHPDRTGERARQAAELAVDVARYSGRPEARALAERWAAGAGLGAPDLTPIAPPPAVLNPPRSALQPSAGMDTAGMVAKPLWSATFADELPVELPRISPTVNAETIPAFGRELRCFPALWGDTIYVAGDRFIAAFNRFTLEPRWRVDGLKAAGIDTEPWDRESAANRGMRRTSQGSNEDISAVAVRGSTVVAVLASEPPGAAEGQELIVALDAATGAVRWAQPAQTLDAALYKTHVRGPIFIDGDVAVFGSRKWQADRRLSALYLTGVDLESGEPRWSVLVGSAGALPYFSPPRIADGGALDDGIVYRVDRLGVLAAYIAQSGRPVWVRRFGSEPADSTSMTNPWQMNLPVVQGQWLYVVAPDRSGVVRVDRLTGRLDGTIPADKLSQPSYVVIAGDRLAAVSDNRLAIVALEAPGEWSARPVSLAPVVQIPGIRGRVSAAGTRLLEPTVQGIEMVDAANPTLALAPIALDNPGNVVTCDDQLLVVDDARVHSYLSWDRADAILTQRVSAAPADPSPAVTLAELSYRAGRSERLLFAIDAAIKSLPQAADADRAEVLRRRLFDAVASMVESSLAPGLAPGTPELAAADVAGLVDRLGLLARRPEERAGQLLLAGADLWRAGQGPRSVEAYQRILADTSLAASSWSSAHGPVQAGDEATRRLEQIVVKSGRAAYGAFDAEARSAIGALPAGASPEVMEALARRYPVAQTTPALWGRIAAANREAGRARAEARALEIGLQRAEGVPDAPQGVVGELAGRLVENLKQRALLVAAGGVLNRFQSRFPGATLTIDQRPMDLTRLKAEVGAELLAQRRWPRVGPPTATGVQTISGWQIMEPEVRSATGVAPPFLVMQAEDNRVALWGRPDGIDGAGPLEALWTSDVPREQVALIRADNSAAWFYWATSAGGMISRVDAAGRAVTWKSQPFNSILPPVERAGGPADRVHTPLDGVRSIAEMLVSTDDRSIAMVERTGRAVILDADSGAVLWAGNLPLQRIVDCAVIANVLVCAGEKEVRGPGGNVASVTPAIAAVDARTGAPIQQFDSPAGAVRWLRLTESGDLIVGMQSAVASFDLESGNSNWRLTQGPAASSIDAWALHDRLLILGEDRSLWQVSTASGAASAGALDTRGRFDTSSAVFGTVTAGGNVAFRSQQGVAVFNQRAELIGADAIGATDNLVVPAPSDHGFVAISMAGTAQNLPESQIVFQMYTLDAQGVLLTTTPVALGTVPGKIALTDGRIAVSAGRNTVVYSAAPMKR